jgi:TolA-binding protein
MCFERRIHSKINRSRLLLAFVTVTLTVPVAALGQGIPDRVAALEAAVTNLQGANSTLQSQVAGLQNQLTGLQGQLSGLQNTVAALQSNNGALQNNVVTLQNQVTGLQNQQHLLDNTVTGLQSQNQVYVSRGVTSGILGAGFALVQAVDVPAGSYLIYAVVQAVGLDADDQTGECYLSTTGRTGAPGSASDETERIKGQGSIAPRENWYAQLPLLDVANFASSTRISLFCTGFAWQVNPTLVAVSIGNIH